MRLEFQVVDAHVASAPVRLLARGVPAPAGSTMEKRRAWFERHADHVRRATMLEPRGRADLVGVLLTEPVLDTSDAGLLFMDAGGYPALNGAAVVAAATIALERGLITKGDLPAGGSRDGAVRLDFDTPAGVVSASARLTMAGGRLRVTGVRVTGVPSFVVRAGCDLQLGSRRLWVDLAYGGAFYAILDSEAAGIPLTPERLPDLRRLGAEICAALDGHEALVHPDAPGVSSPAGVVFTSPPQAQDAHLRSVTVVAHGGCDPSPGVTGTSAVMAVLSAMGLLREGDDLVGEGLHGLVQRGSVVRSASVGEVPAVVPEIEAAAWITGEQTLFVEDDDPLAHGIG